MFQLVLSDKLKSHLETVVLPSRRRTNPSSIQPPSPSCPAFPSIKSPPSPTTCPSSTEGSCVEYPPPTGAWGSCCSSATPIRRGRRGRLDRKRGRRAGLVRRGDRVLRRLAGGLLPAVAEGRDVRGRGLRDVRGTVRGGRLRAEPPLFPAPGRTGPGVAQRRGRVRGHPVRGAEPAGQARRHVVRQMIDAHVKDRTSHRTAPSTYSPCAPHRACCKLHLNPRPLQSLVSFEHTH